jgi:hypothetical protein
VWNDENRMTIPFLVKEPLIMKLKSPLGYALAAAAFALTVSPETRKTARLLAVKGTEMVLDLVEQAKSAGAKVNEFAQESGTKQTANTPTYTQSLESHSQHKGRFD